jgi:hypothetical protein
MARKNGLYGEVVHQVAIMPEYPTTSAGGIAYCVDVSGMDHAMAKELHENVSINVSVICILSVYKTY